MICRYTAAHTYGPVGGENFIINEHLNNPDIWTRPTHPSWKNYIALKDKKLVFDKKGISIFLVCVCVCVCVFVCVCVCVCVYILILMIF